MSSTATLILDHQQIRQKLKRIAFQIYEANHHAETLFLVAVERQGSLLAAQLLPMLEAEAPFAVKVLNLRIDKRNPLEDIVLDGDGSQLEGQDVVLVDDVLNSGRTLMYAARHLLRWSVRSLHTVVLVDRKHRKFPIKADFVGLTLSTTLQEHINVVFEEDGVAAYLEG